MSLAFHLVFEAAPGNLSMLCPAYSFLYQASSDSKNQCAFLALIVVKGTAVKLCHDPFFKQTTVTCFESMRPGLFIWKGLDPELQQQEQQQQRLLF